MKIIVNTPKPRNPLVAHALFRRARSHRPGGRMQRRQGARELRRELSQHSP